MAESKGITTKKRAKIFNDPVHGTISVNYLCSLIIDTPQFQRLRYIKQLGGCDYVYPNATHSRFAHSIGVYHLAGKFARTLKRNHPNLDITEKDILCVEIAGLCHDLGHGPYSHVFDKLVIPKITEEDWKHEDASIAMLDHLLEDERNINVKDAFGEQLVDEKSIVFIKEMIKKPNDSKAKYPYKGQPSSKQFLYEIVANSRNGIDVDKWDYFARDCLMLGIPNSFDHNRFMEFARVRNVDNVDKGELPGPQICMRDKEAYNLYDMFRSRADLHRRAYKHKDTVGVELMFSDALILASDHLEELGIRNFSKPVPHNLVGCTEDMSAYIDLTDSIFHLILLSTSETDDLIKAKKIIQNIMCKKFYKCICQSNQLKKKWSTKLKKKEENKLRKAITACSPEEGSKLSEDDIVVNVMTLDYGMKAKDPINSVRFYSKADETSAKFLKKDQVSHMLPSVFEETLVSVYCKHPDNRELCKLTAECFNLWCQKSKNPKMGTPPIEWLLPN